MSIVCCVKAGEYYRLRATIQAPPRKVAETALLAALTSKGLYSKKQTPD